MAKTTTSTNSKKELNSDHLAALAQGREEGRIVRRYLEALDSKPKTKRGRKVKPEDIEKRVKAAEQELQLDGLDVIRRLELTDVVVTGKAQLAAQDQVVDLTEVEDEFVKVAAAYSTRKGYSKATWLAIGVPAAVLKRAGVT